MASKKFTSMFRGVRGRLLVLIMVPLFLTVALSSVAIMGLKSQYKDLKYISGDRLEMTQQLAEIRTSVHAIGRYLWISYGWQENLEKRNKNIEEVRARIKAFDTAYEAYGKLDTSDGGKDFYNKVKAPWQEMKVGADEVIGMLEKNEATTNEEARKVILARFYGPATAISKALEEAKVVNAEANQKIVNSAEISANKIQNFLLGVSLFGAISVLIYGLYMSRKLSSQLGDITDRIAMTSSEVQAASQQMASASMQLSSGSTEGAASLEETTASIDQIAHLVKVNSGHSDEAAKASTDGCVVAENGEKQIKNLITTMSGIADGATKIEGICTVIDDIAFQTNLLALNAAVEAARAGEQGRGFAVVAEAVRALAQKSGTAAKDISTLVKENADQAAKGMDMVDKSTVALGEIVQVVKKVAAINADIANASREQSNGLSQISSAMAQLDQVTQRNAATSEETAASSEELSAQSQLLKRMVDELRVVVDGAGTSTGVYEEINTTPHDSMAEHNNSKAAEVIPFNKKAA